MRRSDDRRKRPADQLRIHLCWGNYEGPHTHDVPLRDVIDLVLAVRVAGTDCGFATFATRPTVHPTIAWAKLQAMAEGAEVASRRLWG